MAEKPQNYRTLFFSKCMNTTIFSLSPSTDLFLLRFGFDDHFSATQSLVKVFYASSSQILMSNSFPNKNLRLLGAGRVPLGRRVPAHLLNCHLQPRNHGITTSQLLLNLDLSDFIVITGRPIFSGKTFLAKCFVFTR